MDVKEAREIVGEELASIDFAMVSEWYAAKGFLEGFEQAKAQAEEAGKEMTKQRDRYLQQADDWADISGKKDAEIARINAELKKYREHAGNAQCVYCGHIGLKNSDAMIDHINVCLDHPVGIAKRGLTAASEEIELLEKELAEEKALNRALHARSGKLVTRCARLVEALEKIANEDYRGNRPNSSFEAEKALKEHT